MRNKTKLAILTILVIAISLGYSCSSDKNKYEVRNIYVDANIAYPSIKNCFESRLKTMTDTLFNWEKNYGQEGSDSIIYNYLDFKGLPTTNLLDGTRRYRISLYEEKDSIGNPLYNMEHFIWDVYDWRRIANFGKTSFYADSLLTEDEMCRFLVKRLSFEYSKALP